MVDNREVSLIVNVRSRLGSRASRQAKEELERWGVRVRESHNVEYGTELKDAVRAVTASGRGIVVVAGGDGTISAVVDFFANRPHLTLGLLPTGTGNEVARILGIPLQLSAACRVVAEGNPIAVDLGEANGDYFVHTALMGYPAHVNHTVPNWLKLHLGKVAYTYALLIAIFSARPFKAIIEANGNRWEGDTILVVVGNGRFHEPGRILLQPSQADKRGLSVYTPRDRQWTTLLGLIIGLWITRTRQPKLLFSEVGDEVVVTAAPPQDVDLDGEFGRFTPMRFRLAREALRVLAPTR